MYIQNSEIMISYLNLTMFDITDVLSAARDVDVSARVKESSRILIYS